MAHNLIAYKLFKIHSYMISVKVFGPSCHAMFDVSWTSPSLTVFGLIEFCNNAGVSKAINTRLVAK